MELPDLVREALGDEDVEAGVSLGDEDGIFVTPTRLLVYRGEGLLSDEDVAAYPHDFERLAVSEGRRKTTFTLTYVDREETFAVPGNRTEAVLERLLEGSLRVGGVLEPDESVTGVFRFSELTLVVAQQRLLKHVGEYTWDGDFEAYHYGDVTGLDFEDGSVATAVVLEADGRPERIKAPNDQARQLRQTLESALFDYHDVGSLDALNRAIDVEEEGTEDSPTDGQSGSLDLEAGIDPLVSGADEGGDGDSAGSSTPAGGDGGAGERTGQRGASTVGLDAPTGSAGADEPVGGDADAELAAVADQLADLTAAVERQNELVEQQQRTVRQLIEELRRGR